MKLTFLLLSLLAADYKVPDESRLQGATLYFRQHPEIDSSVGELLHRLKVDRGVMYGTYDPGNFIEDLGKSDPNFAFRLNEDIRQRKGVVAKGLDLSQAAKKVEKPIEYYGQFLILERFSLWCIAKEMPTNDKFAAAVRKIQWPETLFLAKYKVLANLKRAGCLSPKAISAEYMPMYERILAWAYKDETPPGTLAVLCYEMVRNGHKLPQDLLDRLRNMQSEDGGWWDPDDGTVYPTLAGVYVLAGELRSRGINANQVINKPNASPPFLPVSQYKHRTDAPSATRAIPTDRYK